MPGNVIHFHSDSRLAHRWSTAAKFYRLREAGLLPTSRERDEDTAPSEMPYEASPIDCA